MYATPVIDHPATLRAGIYGRQSKSNTASIEEQTAECRADAESEGWTVAEVYSDGVSASRFSKGIREDWARLLADLAAGALDVLLLWESSRGDRDLPSWASMLATCRSKGVLIRVTTHGRTYDMSKARDWKQLAEDGVDSAYESEKTSLRGRRAAAAGAIAGRPHGRIPYGYERVYDPATKALVEQRPDPKTAPIVREIISRIAKSDPISTITRDLNERGIPSPTGIAWGRRMVRVIAINPTYVSRRPHGGEVHAGNWPPLVDDATFYAAQRVLTDPVRKVTKPGRVKYLLSYLATCGVCGEPLGVNPALAQYRCSAKGCAAVRMADLDDLVTRLTVQTLGDPEVYEQLRHGTDDAAALVARSEAEELRARLDEWRDSAARGETSPASLARIEPKLLADIAAAERRAVDAATPPVLRALVSPNGDAQARWESAPLAARREAIRLLLTIRLHPTQHAGSREFDPSRVDITWKGRP